MTVPAVEARLLTRAAFAPFGEVIETADAPHFPINDRTAERYDTLARIELLGEGPRGGSASFARSRCKPP